MFRKLAEAAKLEIFLKQDETAKYIHNGVNKRYNFGWVERRMQEEHARLLLGRARRKAWHPRIAEIGRKGMMKTT